MARAPKAKPSKAKEKLADMIEEAIDARIEEIVEFCEKHRLSYTLDIEITAHGETDR